MIDFKDLRPGDVILGADIFSHAALYQHNLYWLTSEARDLNSKYPWKSMDVEELQNAAARGAEIIRGEFGLGQFALLLRIQRLLDTDVLHVLTNGKYFSFAFPDPMPFRIIRDGRVV